MAGDDDLVPAVSQFDWDRVMRPVPLKEDVLLDQKIPSSVNVNAVLGHSPDRPYDAKMKADHPCSEPNGAYFKCFNQEAVQGFAMHERVCYCYDEKTALQQCLAREKREEKKRAAQQREG
eukprot:TRINITY_DN30149_c0_g2_i4.p2 TRINITY_DN30149_c0_g2~~TRINITY_DN30149_c0_g2_i4.p2  ORF type:complete len:135 (+),score=27.44 TRINITY_DN30149_c0_g2_i4:47-406(+)